VSPAASGHFGFLCGRQIFGANAKNATMNKMQRIGAGKASFRRTMLAEHLAARQMEPMDLVRLLNEPESALPIDKKQVYRWLEGKMPHKDTLDRIAAALRLESPEDLFRHPDEIWIRQLLKDKSDEERERIKATLLTAFPIKKAS
jgi:hypothetical protein